jgi:hypothetical protein
MRKVISNSRSSIIPLFSSIVKESYKKMMGLDPQVKKLRQEFRNTEDEDREILIREEIFETEKELAKLSIIVIVFSAMATEAYIYDYAARHLGDNFVKAHLDKLDVISKWVIIPELITGKEMPRHENWRERLAKLIKVRNSIIHHKSSEPPAVLVDAEKYLKRLSDETELTYETARQSITLLGVLADKIIEIDPEETPWVKSYLV